MKTGSLYMIDKTAFSNDAIMSEAREFLMELIEGGNMAQPHLLTICYKIIMRIGLLRSNPEDFLLVNELLTSHPEHALKVDLRDEVRDIMEASGASVAESEGDSKDESNKNDSQYEFLPSYSLNCLPMLLEPYNQFVSNTDLMCTDGRFFYWKNDKGLYKATIAGINALSFKLVEHNKDIEWPEHSQMLLYKDKLYVRHKDNGREKAFLVYNTCTLKVIEDFEIKIKDEKEENAEGSDGEESAKSD